MTVPSRITMPLQTLSKWLNTACWNTGVALLLTMLAAVALQVVARYVFFSPPAWTEELARYCMVWAGFLGATVAYYKSADPVIASPTGGTAGRQLALLVLRNLAALVFLFPVIYWSPLLLSHHMLRETESMKLVSAWVFVIVPIFSTVILVHVSARLLSAVIGAVDQSKEQ